MRKPVIEAPPWPTRGVTTLPQMAMVLAKATMKKATVGKATVRKATVKKATAKKATARKAMEKRRAKRKDGCFLLSE